VANFWAILYYMQTASEPCLSYCVITDAWSFHHLCRWCFQTRAACCRHLTPTNGWRFARREHVFFI